MRVEELRIGNLVRQYGFKGDVEVDLMNIREYDCLEPLDLTEQWLLKFGFISDPYSDTYDKTGLVIQINKTRGKLELWWAGAVPMLDYVHQLQNLYFALTGKELCLKN